jgi:hypothetical protein
LNRSGNGSRKVYQQKTREEDSLRLPFSASIIFQPGEEIFKMKLKIVFEAIEKERTSESKSS